jgi:hypothetical protein
MTTDTVKMTRNANNVWPQPLQQNLLRALEGHPEARAIVIKTLADTTIAKPETAAVHVDEVESWAAQGWQRADTSQ